MKNDKILILTKHKKDFTLLKNNLSFNYNILDIKNLDEFNNIDLIITDQYSYHDKKNLINKLIKDQKPLLLPLIMISRNPQKGLIREGFNGYLNEYVKMPISKSVILKKIKKLLELRFYSKQVEKKYDLIVENSPVGIIVTDNNGIKYCNSYAVKLLGHNFEKIIINNLELKKVIFDLNNEVENYEVKFKKTGAEKYLLINSKIMPYQDHKTLIYIIKDITKQKKREKEIEYMLYHDDLTNLYNRKYLNDSILENPDTLKDISVGFIVLDINNLKLINETLSNQLGDKIIQKISRIIERLADKKDLIFRAGGDEFLVILPERNLLETEKLMDKIKLASEEKYADQVQLSLGAGAAVKKASNKNIFAVIKKATENMYLNKLTENYSFKSHIIKSVLKTLQVKSFETEDHASRMDQLAIELGKKAGLNRYQLDELSMLAKLHDIGKVAIPESILKKPAKLNQKEYDIIKTHPEIGYQIVESIPHLNEVALGVLSHHERWDGNGYPQGLKGEKTPLIARIITIIDSFDVMTNERSYKKAYSIEYAVEELKRCSGSQFDPQLVEIFINKVLFEEISSVNSI
ncbi:HD domain-containing phosphohydrolase [Halanaerobium sp. ST460_2HS_T2]|nr:HD domain-containing phosphohydrolase [Halanaerobium sp. ST460_2HS_T2]